MCQEDIYNACPSIVVAVGEDGDRRSADFPVSQSVVGACSRDWKRLGKEGTHPGCAWAVWFVFALCVLRIKDQCMIVPKFPKRGWEALHRRRTNVTVSTGGRQNKMLSIP